jgi:prepilin-type N-terminal cleavage/methylation domain-containing protein
MRKTSQAGFTLLEVMIASAASMAVIAPALVFMLDAYDWYAEVQSELTLNREARQVFDLIGNGAKSATNGNDGTPYLYGLRGRKATPAAALRTNYALRYQSNNLTVPGDSFGTRAVTCTSLAVPLPDCPATVVTKLVMGWIGSDPLLNSATRSSANRTVEVTVTVTDPFQAQRAANPVSASETYRTVFTLNRDIADP